MSKYVLMPVENLEVLTGKRKGDVDYVLKDVEKGLDGIDNGKLETLNPENLIMMTSALLMDLPSGNKLNEKVLKFIWPYLNQELKDKGVL